MYTQSAVCNKVHHIPSGESLSPYPFLYLIVSMIVWSVSASISLTAVREMSFFQAYFCCVLVNPIDLPICRPSEAENLEKKE